MATKGRQGTEVTAPKATALVGDEMPDFLRGKGGARGQENVGIEDLVIPRLEVVQDLSPCRKRNDPSYIEGAQEGMLYNNVTRQLYGEAVLVVPVGFVKEWLIWRDRDSGGGFRGAFATAADARQAIMAMDDGDDCEIVDTNQQFCLLINDDGCEEIVVSMAKSKAKVSRKWNALIRMSESDSFSRVYRLSAVPDTNAKNQSYYNLSVSLAGFPSLEVYQRAEKM